MAGSCEKDGGEVGVVQSDSQSSQSISERTNANVLGKLAALRRPGHALRSGPSMERGERRGHVNFVSGE